MLQTEFIKSYCERSGITEETLHKGGQFSVVCDCGDETCLGWAMVRRSHLEDHVKFSIVEDKLVCGE